MFSPLSGFVFALRCKLALRFRLESLAIVDLETSVDSCCWDAVPIVELAETARIMKRLRDAPEYGMMSK